MQQLDLKLFVDDYKIDFVNSKFDVVQARMQTALTLLVAALEADELKRTTFVGKGISGDAARETYDTQEKLRRAHEAAFGTEDERRAEVSRIQSATRQNSMVPEKTR
jgi:hypothetical protein